MQLGLAGFTRESVVDGPGLRFVVFAQGCKHDCPGCQNPETHPFEGGRVMDVTDVFAEIKRGIHLRGVTFSGGDPFYQAPGFTELALQCKEAELDVVAYTGFTYEELLQSGDQAQQALLRATDILIDGPFMQNEKDLSLAFRGSRNQRIIDVPQSLASGTLVRYGK